MVCIVATLVFIAARYKTTFRSIDDHPQQSRTFLQVPNEKASLFAFLVSKVLFVVLIFVGVRSPGSNLGGFFYNIMGIQHPILPQLVFESVVFSLSLSRSSDQVFLH